MATAVSGTGPTYVFLVMEALIDAAVHLGFPRHIAHDLVIETLEGSTLFAKQSGMHPAELRNMVTSPGGTSAAALHELEVGRLRTVLSEAVWAAFRRTVELGDQLEASVGAPASGPSPTRRVTAGSARRTSADPPSTSVARPWPTFAPSIFARPGATSGPTRPRSGTACSPRGPGLDEAAWHLPGAAPSDAGGPDWSLAEHVGHLADWQELAIDYVGTALQTGRWPSDDDYDGGDFDRFNERRRAPWTTMPSATIVGPPAGRPAAPARGSREAFARRAPRRRRLGLGVHDPPWPLPRPPRGHRAVGRSAS